LRFGQLVQGEGLEEGRPLRGDECLQVRGLFVGDHCVVEGRELGRLLNL
jgi:hypothetical protein